MRLALPYAMMCLLTPAAFRDPILLRREAETIRAAKGALAEMQGAETAGDAPAGIGAGDIDAGDRRGAPAPTS
ncbi:hypothetical protein VQ042_06825 [Aurantimonas sp. A2-1-M11]|uniref:hypothetical protein n=1 Tax=Aurantimonas sp. A2-1-M11 TaxID=3113712 RepID=UPI002F92C675